MRTSPNSWLKIGQLWMISFMVIACVAEAFTTVRAQTKELSPPEIEMFAGREVAAGRVIIKFRDKAIATFPSPSLNIDLNMALGTGVRRTSLALAQ